MANDKPADTAVYEKLVQALLPWYRKNARPLPWRRDREPYHVWLSEIMLQQTRVEAVRGYYERFLTALPTIRDLAEAPETQLFKLWEGLGYYSRVRNLQKAAKKIMETGGKFPNTYDEIRALPGIGPYTAGAVSSICFERPRAAVDGNVLRITARLTGSEAPIDLPEVKRGVTEALERVYPAGHCGEFTQALMELGQAVCTPKSPKCETCPCAAFCCANAAGNAEKLPVRLPKREKRLEQKTVFLLTCAGKTAIEKRREKGLLAGMWQLPNVPGHLNANEALQAAEELGAKPVALEKELHKTHIFTHIRWEMVGYAIECREESGAFVWATPQQLAQEYALPTAFRIFLDAAQD